MNTIALAWKTYDSREWVALTVYGTFRIVKAPGPWWVRVADWKARGCKVYFRNRPIGWAADYHEAARIATNRALEEANKREATHASRN